MILQLLRETLFELLLCNRSWLGRFAWLLFSALLFNMQSGSIAYGHKDTEAFLLDVEAD
jgi:hypothetical protein